jgi:hypothetical protein
MGDYSNPDKTQNVQMLYQTSGQSMWQSDQQATWSGSSGDALLVKWGFGDSGNGKADLDFLGKFGGGGDVKTSGTLGFVASASVTAGSVDVDCPLKVILAYPTYIPESGCFAVQTSLAIDKSASLRTHSPNASAELTFQVDASVGAGVDVEAFSDELMDWSFSSGSLTTKGPVSLGKVTATGAVNSMLPPLQYPTTSPVFTAQVKVPCIDTVNKTSGGTSLSSTGKDYLLSMSLDLTNLIVEVLEAVGVEVPPLNEKISYPGGHSTGSSASDSGSGHAYSVELGYAILDAAIDAFVGVQQDFTFTPTPQITLAAVDPSTGAALQAYADAGDGPGAPLTGPVPVGARVWFKMPAPPPGSTAKACVQITPTVTYDCSFQNRTSLAIWGEFDFTPFSVEVGGECAGISLPSFDWTPWKATPSLGQLTVASQTFTPKLSGFPTSVTGAAFSVPQQNMPLPGIASVTVNNAAKKATPYNRPYNDDGSGDDPGSLAVNVTSDSVAWDLKRTAFYLDKEDAGHALQAVSTSSGTVAQLNVPANVLTPGIHTIIAVASYDDNQTTSGSGTGPDFMRRSSMDLPVEFFVPAIQELHQVDGANNDIVDSIPAGSAQRTLFVTGLGFGPIASVGDGGATTPAGPGSRIFLQGQPLPLHPRSSIEIGQIMFDVPAAMLAAPGSYALTVVNPAPGGGTSASFPFTVASATPTLKGVRPAAGPLVVDGPDTTILLDGTGFLPGCVAVASASGQKLTTTLISPTSASAVVPAKLLADRSFSGSQPPALAIHIENPRVTSKNGVSTGGKSADVTVPVTVPAPYVSQISPAAAVMGAGNLAVTITGTSLLGKVSVNVTPPGGPTGSFTVSMKDPGHGTLTLPASALRVPGTVSIKLASTYGGKTSSAQAGFQVLRSCFYGDDDGTLYAVDAAGNLRWYKDLARDGTVNWDPNSGNVISQGGWDQCLMIIPAGGGVLYAVKANGDLAFYQDLARNGTSRWSSTSGAIVDHGWDAYVWAVSCGGGMIYALDKKGALRWYKDLARNGSVNWADGSRNSIASGWDSFCHVAAGGNGILYAADTSGNLQWHQDQAQNGRAGWAAASGSVVGHGGWTQFTHLMGGGGGILYPVMPSGDLRFYRDTAMNGTEQWAPNSSAAIRHDFTYCGPT